MDIHSALAKGYIVVLDPASPSSFGQSDEGKRAIDVNDFFATYGGVAEEVAIIGKGEGGRATFRSMAVPNDPNLKTFFNDFVSLAADLGIQTHGVLHSFGDAYQGQDGNYSVRKSGGMEIPEFVCPTETSLWKYIATAARDTIKNPISSLIFMEHHYPRQEYCFCRRCRREFAELTGLNKNMTYNDITNSDIKERYVEWRSEIIGHSFSEVHDIVKSERKGYTDLNVAFTIPIDPETGWTENIRQHFGIDVDILGAFINNFIFHLMPFSPMYPEPGTETYKDLVSDLRNFIRSRNLDVSLFVWGMAQEESTDWLDKLKQDIKAKNIYVRLDYPKLYSVKREIQRGLV